jgi:hypothetical protein
VITGANACLRAAFEAGYRATPDGRVLDPLGQPVALNKSASNGYWSFSAKGCRSPISLHRFVAFQLHGEPAIAAECVRHKNDDRDDNRFDNILFGSRSDNQFDIPDAKRSQMGVRRNRGKRRFEPDEVRAIRGALAAGTSVNKLRRRFLCSLGAIANIRDGVTYRDVA